LLPTAIILALYVSGYHSFTPKVRLNSGVLVKQLSLGMRLQYTICDIILLFQIYYYRANKQRSDLHLAPSDSVTEESPLLDVHTHEGNVDPDQRGLYKILAQYSGMFLIVFATGVISWWISTRYQYDAQKPSGPKASELTIQVIGWSSAVLYCE
jgi:hypothetical protein